MQEADIRAVAHESNRYIPRVSFGSVCVCLYMCKVTISVTDVCGLFCLGTPLWYSLLWTASLYLGLCCYALQEIHGTLLYQST